MKKKLKKLKVTMKLTNGEEFVEKVNWEHGVDFAKHGLIDPNNPDGDSKLTDNDLKLRYMQEQTVNNFFNFAGGMYNMRYIGMIQIEVENSEA